MKRLQFFSEEGIALLRQLIATPSTSKTEEQTAGLLFRYLQDKGLKPQRKYNNVWAEDKHWKAERPVMLLNSHHDTVKPVESWSRDPYVPEIQGGKLYGLGSNDAGGPLVAMLMAFLHLSAKKDKPYNLIFLATAEEEISGKYGMEAMIEELGPVSLGIVGEPTNMELVIAEKGLLVVDCTAKGKSGHAARGEGINAIYRAMEDICKIQHMELPLESKFLGPVKMTVSQIQGGVQHNVVPDTCRFVVDVRTNEHYSNQAVLHLLEQNLAAEVKARSLRLNSSSIAETHPLVVKGRQMGLSLTGSPTLSDQALMPYPSLKIGPGHSARSHTADEFIRVDEITQGIRQLIALLQDFGFEAGS